MFLNIQRSVHQHQVELSLFALFQILYILIIFFSLVIPFFVGYPVCSICRIIWICVLWWIYVFREFVRTHTTMIVGCGGVLRRFVYFSREPSCILDWSGIEIYAIDTWCGGVEGIFLQLDQPRLLSLLAVLLGLTFLASDTVGYWFLEA